MHFLFLNKMFKRITLSSVFANLVSIEAHYYYYFFGGYISRTENIGIVKSPLKRLAKTPSGGSGATCDTQPSVFLFFDLL